MIYGIFHKGSGLGNQLHRYVAARSLADQKGYEFGMVAPSLFKGAEFMNLDMDNKVDYFGVEEITGKVVADIDLPLWEEKTNYYNPEFNFIEDNTIIDGEFQDERYFDLEKVGQWLETESLEVPDNVCIIGFRGGEFSVFPELFLPKEYWDTAIAKMREINPQMLFEVHTDDQKMAMDFFPQFKVIQDIEINWRSMRYAKYAIIANSSFYILPRLLRQEKYMTWDMKWANEDTLTIAPRYWARHNTKEWSMPQNYYKSFQYI